MGSTQYKEFLDCEARAMARLNGEYEEGEKSYFLVGQYVHAWNQGILEDFIEKNKESIFTKTGAFRAEFSKANEVIDSIKNDPFFMKAISGEKEVIFKAKMFGCEWKICIDSYFPDKGRFCDLKIIKSLYDKFWNKDGQYYESVIEHYGYIDQVAIYAEVERLATKREAHLEPFIAVATKETVPDREVISFNNELMSHSDFITSRLEVIKSKMPRILAVKSGKEIPTRCEKCDYCKLTKKLKRTKSFVDFNLY